MNKLQGVFPIVNTAFQDDGSLDVPSQCRLVEFLIEAGAHGLGLFGNASEGYTLSTEERRTLLRTIRKQVGGRVPLVISTGSTGTDLAVELSREAEGEGAAAVMVLPPFFLRTDADGLRYYYQAISNAIRVPIMIQDAPLMTGVVLSATLLLQLAREIEHVAYVKVEAPPTAPKVSALIGTGGPVVFGGLNGQFMIEELERGARGVMPGSDMTGIFVEIWTRMENGDKATAWRLFSDALPLIRFELQPGLGVSAMKHNLAAAGILRTPKVRHPTSALDARSREELRFLREWTEAARNRTMGVRPVTAP